MASTANLTFVYLASQSPRRADLLSQLGMTYQLLLADESEDAESLEVIKGAEAPAVYVKRVTQLKLEAAIERAKARRLWPAPAGQPAAPILCADTTVAMGSRIFGKPMDAEDAARMLKALAGQTHRVLTAVGVAWQKGRKHESALLLSQSKVTFAPLSARDIATYVATGEPLGKAGSYGVQGRAAAFISKISGSYSSIMGLPLHETALLLRQAGVR